MGFNRVGDRGLREAIERAYKAAKESGRLAEAERLEAERRKRQAPDRPAAELIEARRRSLAGLPSYHLDFLRRVEQAEEAGREVALKFGLRSVRAAWAAGAWWEQRQAHRLGLLLAEPDSGRSTALTWLGRYAAETGRQVRYLSAGRVADLVREGHLERFYGADLLLIDNLDATPPGAWAEPLEGLVESYHAAIDRGCFAAARPPIERLVARVGQAVVAHLTDRHAGGKLFEDTHG